MLKLFKSDPKESRPKKFKKSDELNGRDFDKIEKQKLLLTKPLFLKIRMPKILTRKLVK